MLVALACSSSDDGGSKPSPDAGTDAGFAASACFGCIQAACPALTVCAADPGCGAYLGCVKACPVSGSGGVDSGCEAACAAAAAPSAALVDARSCLESGSGCAACGADAGPDVVSEADTKNPALDQQCVPVDEPDPCVDCVLDYCCDSADAILGNGPGAAMNDCINACDGANADDCQYACAKAHPDGIPDYGGWFACYGVRCAATDACSAPDACTDCLFTSCAEALADCYTDVDCLSLYYCMYHCEDAACGTQCMTTHAAGQQRFGDLFDCTATCPC